MFAHPDASEAEVEPEAEQHTGGLIIEEVTDEAAATIEASKAKGSTRISEAPDDAVALGPGALEGVVQQLTSLQQQPTSKVRVYLGSEILQKVADTEDLLPPAPPTLVRHLSLQRAPALQRAISGAKDLSRPPTLDRSKSAPAKLAVDWSRAWGSGGRSTLGATSGDQGYPNSDE